MVRVKVRISGGKSLQARLDKIITNLPRISLDMRQEVLAQISRKAIENILTEPISKGPSPRAGTRYFGTGPLSGIITNQRNWLVGHNNATQTSTLFPPARIGTILEKGTKPHDIPNAFGSGMTFEHPGFQSVGPISKATRTIINTEFKKVIERNARELVNG